MVEDRDIILKAENISKQYRLGLVGTGTISHDLNRWWSRVRGKEDPYLKVGDSNDRSTKGESEYVWALQNINFEVKRGEVLGIIGKNGAGKSTLLKILSKVTGPTTGEIKTRGRIASLLEVGTGFHGEMTGRENVFLNGAILGMSKKEITSKIDEIIAFSGCQRYIDTPVKRYSSGMTVRLAFAVAAFLEPEILVIDEVLAVGDAEFQKKAIGKMQDISQGEGRTVLFVSHNMAAVKNLCTRGILLENGEIKTSGTIEAVLNEYQRISKSQGNYFVKESKKDFYIASVKIEDSNNAFYSNQAIKITIRVGKNNEDIKNKFLLIRVLDNIGQVLFSLEKALKDKDDNYSLVIPKETLVKGSYKINCIIYHPAVAQYDNIEECCGFDILNNSNAFSHLETFNIGKMYVSSKWLN
ncbi:polysaccharide ABC transporter ATP-binding protein [Olleya sp. HaHaR_3_96]|uniref:ABC transporter ATP-binding protein n=1 Tax=Olleya sp. HaHaR_3_96 TaxID=2745560 RepID=UPI001C4FF251|nr:ABC transporter ATP-binding protein [Olleya sp. HaHaR_3_96]QXP61675.1 ATP-binding cassette domain-containing protein [Olleya sp. HaHaR_3_96]